MVALWIEANHRAEAERDWVGRLGPFFTDDAEYRWNAGPNEEFLARGPEEIARLVFGEQMEGFEGWSYPYEDTLIDEKRGEVVAFWRQIAPVTRADGSPYAVAGICGSRFRYAGDRKWSSQVDFFDLGNVVALLGELAADGHLSGTLKARIHRTLRGGAQAGHRTLREDYTFSRRAKANLSMARIALLGR